MLRSDLPGLIFQVFDRQLPFLLTPHVLITFVSPLLSCASLLCHSCIGKPIHITQPLGTNPPPRLLHVFKQLSSTIIYLSAAPLQPHRS